MKNVLLLLTVFVFLSSQRGLAQNVGEMAPDFTLDVLDGGTFTLSEQEDKVVLIFVFGYTCHFCISSAPTVEEKLITPYEEYEDFVAIGIDIWDGSASGVETFREESGLDIPLLMMGSGFVTSYNTIQDRIIVIDREGKIAYKNNGGAGSVTHQVIPVIEEKLGISVPTALEIQSSLSESLKAYPNPVTAQTTLRFALENSESVRINLHASDGRLVQQIHEGFLSSGEHAFALDLSQMSTGIYFAHLTGKGINEVLRIMKH